MGLDEITGKDLASTDTTVVRALGTGETHLGPSKDLSIGVKQGVLLLESEPGLLLLDRVHRLFAGRSVVGAVGRTVVVVAFTQNEEVLASSERIAEHGDGALRHVSCATLTTQGERGWG